MLRLFFLFGSDTQRTDLLLFQIGQIAQIKRIRGYFDVHLDESQVASYIELDTEKPDRLTKKEGLVCVR